VPKRLRLKNNRIHHIDLLVKHFVIRISSFACVVLYIT